MTSAPWLDPAAESRPMRIAVFASGSGGNLAAAMILARYRPDLGRVVVVVSDRPGCRAVSVAACAGIPTISRDCRAECGRASECRNKEETLAYADRVERFHDRIDSELARFELVEGPIDLVVLSYGRLIRGRLLDRFTGRMINQHPGDLTTLDETGNRILVGNDPVLAALRLGAVQVRTSTFFVDGGEDTGPIISQGPALQATGIPPRRKSADCLERMMKRGSDWPSLVCALILIAEGAVSVDPVERMEDGSHRILVRGMPMELGGLKLMEGLDRPEKGVNQICDTVRSAIECCSSEWLR